MNAMTTRTHVIDTPRREAMRIAGRLVTTDDVIEVRNPYDGSLVGTVPAARAGSRGW